MTIVGLYAICFLWIERANDKTAVNRVVLHCDFQKLIVMDKLIFQHCWLRLKPISYVTNNLIIPIHGHPLKNELLRGLR